MVMHSVRLTSVYEIQVNHLHSAKVLFYYLIAYIVLVDICKDDVNGKADENKDMFNGFVYCLQVHRWAQLCRGTQ